MEKRVFLAVALSVAVLFAFNYLSPPPKRPAAVPAASSSQGQPAAQPAPAPIEAPSQASTQPAAAPSESAQSLVGETQDREVVVENDAVRATFSTRGGVMTSWRLKRYAENGQPLDLVPHNVPPGQPKPFTLATDDQGVNATLDKALFKPSVDSLNTSAPGTLSFEYRDSSGLSATKEFSFAPDHPYDIVFSAKVSKGDAALVPTIAWGPALGTGRISSGMTYAPSPQPIYYRDGDVARVAFDKIAEHRVVEGTIGFGGVDDHYFLTSIISPAQQVRLQYDPVPVPVAGSDRGLHFVSWAVRPSNGSAKLRFFAGPKDFEVLKDAGGSDFTRAIHFGRLGALVVSLLRALNWVNGYVGNYGWSIIVLTVIINLAMFPLRHKSVVSMRKMQELQPQVKAIQDRYAKLKMSDPARQKMNAELMNLYRERGVNPASGCVPMLLTLPVLFAFYAMLSVAIELRGAPFMGWIKDLSTYDPWFVTPIVMGLTQFVQQRMTPATGDPAQQRMMMFMPLIFMTMFIWAPSGLVLYWTVSNLWAIGQQVLTNRLIGPAPQRAGGAAAERRLKQAGGGKTDAAKERK